MTLTLSSLVNLKFADELPKSFDEVTAPRSFYAAKDGLIEIRKGRFTKSLRKIAKFDLSSLGEMLPATGLDDNKAHIVTNETVPTVPREAFRAVLEFYKWANDDGGNEAQVNFYFNRDNIKLPKWPGVKDWGKGVVSYTPIQSNSSALTSVHKDGREKYEWFRSNLDPFLETHSHNTMEAFMSGTDRDNSKTDGFQLVFGHIDSEEFHIKGWVTTLGEIYTYLDDDAILRVMDLPCLEHRVYDENEELISSEKTLSRKNFDPKKVDKKLFPADWIKQVKVDTLKNWTSKFGGGWGGTGYNFSKTGRGKRSYVEDPIVGDPSLDHFIQKAANNFEEEEDFEPWDKTAFPHFDPREEDLDLDMIPPYSQLTPDEQDNLMDRLDDEVETATSYGMDIDAGKYAQWLRLQGIDN